MPLFQFPKTIRLDSRKTITIRPLRKEDEKKLHEYFLRLPPEKVDGFKDDVTDPEVVKEWIYDLDYDRALPLVALDDGRIVADAALKFDDLGRVGPQGKICASIDPEYRDEGLIEAMFEEIVVISMEMGLERITAELSPRFDDNYPVFEKMGFVEAAVLKNFVKDRNGDYDDLVIMVKSLLN